MPGQTRTFLRFAWLPVTTAGGRVVWLEKYNVKQTWLPKVRNPDKITEFNMTMAENGVPLVQMYPERLWGWVITDKYALAQPMY